MAFKFYNQRENTYVFTNGLTEVIIFTRKDNEFCNFEPHEARVDHSNYPNLQIPGMVPGGGYIQYCINEYDSSYHGNISLDKRFNELFRKFCKDHGYKLFIAGRFKCEAGETAPMKIFNNKWLNYMSEFLGQYDYGSLANLFFS